MQLRGGGETADWPDWVPLAFQLLPLTTRWLISFQCILFLLGHLMPDHPCFGANGGAVSSLGFDPVQILQPLFMGRTGDSARAGFSTGKRLAVVTVFLQVSCSLFQSRKKIREREKERYICLIS